MVYWWSLLIIVNLWKCRLLLKHYAKRISLIRRVVQVFVKAREIHPSCGRITTKFLEATLCACPLEIPTPGWEPVIPRGPHPMAGDGAGNWTFKTPGDEGFFENSPRFLGDLFLVWLMCGSKKVSYDAGKWGIIFWNPPETPGWGIFFSPEYGISIVHQISGFAPHVSAKLSQNYAAVVLCSSTTNHLMNDH